MKKTLLLRVAAIGLLLCTGIAGQLKAQLTASVTNQTNVFCANACTGSATVTATGGTPTYSYNWSPSGGTGNSANNLCAGVYTCTVTDAALSSANVMVTITQPPAITINVSSVNSNCSQANGSATAIPSGGNAPYTYMWSPSGGIGATATNLVPGTYTITVTDANGCVATNTVLVGNNSGPVVNIPTPSTLCQGGGVQLSPNVFNGNPPYTFMWSPANSLSSSVILNPVASPTVTTTYTLVVTDSWGCSAFASVTVSVHPGMTLSTSVTNASCNQSNGSATANLTGGTGPFNYQWSNGATTALNSSIPAGSYTITVTDGASGCTVSAVANVSNNGGPSVSTSTVPSSCANSSNGSITASASGNAPPFSYSWLTSPPVNNASMSSLAPGTYTVQVTDNAGCISFAQDVVGQLSGNLYLYATTSSPSNCGTPTGAAYATAMGGTPPYNYLWSNNSTSSTVSGLLSGLYSITVTDANGCVQSGSTSIGAMCVNVVRGRVYNDLNGNCVFDNGDQPTANVLVRAMPGNYYYNTDSAGYFSAWLFQPGNYTVDAVGLNSPYTVSVCPPGGTYTINFPSLGDTVSNQDFSRQILPNIQDLVLTMASGIARPGFQQYYTIQYSNVGSVTVSDTIFFHHDSILSLLASSPAMDGYNAPDGYWLFNNLQPGQSGTIYVTMQVPTIQNGGYLGRSLIGNARIEPTATDTTPVNNGDDEWDIIQGSYDPNLKESWAPHMDSLGNILLSDSTLSYTIHFQNTGTDTAFTVVVIDTLPPQLDITTLVPGASSHPYTLGVRGAQGQNELTFTFNNILLPDSFVNEPRSHGFVKFKITTLPGQTLGTVISNSAANYFDFNLPVLTNTVNNTIVGPLSVHPSQTGGMTITVAPNPLDESATLSFGSSCSFDLTLYDVTGRIVLRSGKQQGNSYVIRRNGLGSGVYICRVNVNGETQTLRLVIR